MNLKNFYVNPFAFDPENLDTRDAEKINDSTIKGMFDMTGNTIPVCAGIAILFRNTEEFPETIDAEINLLEGEPLNLKLEAKVKGEKYSEFPCIFSGNLGMFHLTELDPRTTELTLCCWGQRNKGKKASFEIILK